MGEADPIAIEAGEQIISEMAPSLSSVWAGRLVLRATLYLIRLLRSAKGSLLELWLACSGTAGLESGHKGLEPKGLGSVALVVCDSRPPSEGSGERGEQRGLTWEKVVPALCVTTRYLDDRGVGSVLIYDTHGVLQSQWGERELRKGLLGVGDREFPEGKGGSSEGGGTGDAGRDLSTKAAPRCAVKLLCSEDWDRCISGAARSMGEGTSRGSKGVEDLVEGYEVRELSGNGGVGALGKPPQLILCLSQEGGAFSLSGFFPWHAKCAEIYRLPLGPDQRSLTRELDSVLEQYFRTKQRFGT